MSIKKTAKEFLKDKSVDERIIIAGIFSSSNITMSAIMLASVAIDFAGDLLLIKQKEELKDLQLKKQDLQLKKQDLKLEKEELKLEKEALEKISNIIERIDHANNYGSISIKDAKSINEDIKFSVNNLRGDKYKPIIDKMKHIKKCLDKKINKVKDSKVKIKK